MIQYLFNSASSKKPQSTKRVAGKVYVTGHNVGGVGPVHTAIEYTSPDGTVTVLSAGPRDGLLYSEVDANGYGNDAPSDNFTVDVVNLPKNTTASQYVRRLIAADSNYGDNVDYDFFPEIQDSHNSNSYVSGLLKATGGSTNTNLGNYYGGGSPLPSCNFSKAGC